MDINRQKIIVILGPTASGKSELAVKIAKYIASSGTTFLGGEIISADSRQVYRHLNIGTGKIVGKWWSVSRQSLKKSKVNSKHLGISKKRVFVYKGIPHHCIDFASPKRVYTAAEYKKCALKAIADIAGRRKLPIICGGTGFYIDTLIYDYPLPAVKPNPKLRKELEKLNAEELFKKLKRLDPRRASILLQNSGYKNKRRLVRALEVIKTTGMTIPTWKDLTNKHDILWLGIKKSDAELKKLIHDRLIKRIRSGMIKEVRDLHKKLGLSWKRLESLGLEYLFVSHHLRNNLTKFDLVRLLEGKIWRYAKRQMTWFKKNQEIHWISNKKEVSGLTKNFLSN